MMRGDIREWEKRKSKYRKLLRRLPAHEYALRESMKESAKEDSQKPGNAQSIYDEIFLHVFAPAVVSYVSWVLTEASRRGTERLYFLSRDGWLLKTAAEKMAEKIKNPPRIRYLKVSRYALRRAEYLIAGRTSLDLICVGGIDITFRKIMSRAALTTDETMEIAQLTGYGDRLDLTLNYAQILELKSQLKDVGLFFEYVMKHSRDCYDAAIGFLRQEGLMDQTTFAVVDSGWIGTTLQSLKNLIRAGMKANSDSTKSCKESGNSGATKPEGYYFGIYEVPEGCDSEDYHGFYINDRQTFFQNIKRKTYFAICLFEAVISSPEGMTLGYGKVMDHYFPVDSEEGNPNCRLMERSRELLDEYLKHYLYYQNNVCGCAVQNETQENRVLYQILKRAMGHPAALEAKTLGGLKFCDDVLEHQMQNVASVWDKEEIKRQRFIHKIMIKFDLKKEIIHESGWPEGSLVNAGKSGLIPQEHCYQFLMYLRKNIKCRRKDAKKTRPKK